MRTVAIVQARMSSTRLPGKALADIAGKPMLLRVVERLRRSRLISDILVATPLHPANSAIWEACKTFSIPCFQGSEEDVLDRYLTTARSAGSPEAIVRITSDCPLIDPGVSDLVVKTFLARPCDYASNSIERTWPRGLDTEVMTLRALEQAHREAKLPHERAHVTPYLYRHPELFRLVSVKGEGRYGGLRWTVDTPADLAFARAVYERLAPDGLFPWTRVLDLLVQSPQIAELNRGERQKPIEEG